MASNLEIRITDSAGCTVTSFADSESTVIANVVETSSPVIASIIDDRDPVYLVINDELGSTTVSINHIVEQVNVNISNSPEIKLTVTDRIGDDGKSAYEIALDNGFVGTAEEWVESLHGADGYAAALNNGFVGSYNDWVAFMTPTRVTATDAFKFWTNDGVNTFWESISVETLVTAAYVDSQILESENRMSDLYVPKITFAQDVEGVVNQMTLDVGSI
jgi:hypothetical protein